MDSLEVRCFCRTKPLLAKCGRDANDNLFVHVKSFHGDRIFTEVYVQGGGIVRIHCRECLRWHTVVIRSDKVERHEEPLPDALQ